MEPVSSREAESAVVSGEDSALKPWVSRRVVVGGSALLAFILITLGVIAGIVYGVDHVSGRQPAGRTEGWVCARYACAPPHTAHGPLRLRLHPPSSPPAVAQGHERDVE